MGLSFRDDLDLARWLALSKRGQAMMRDVLLGKDGEKFMTLVAERLTEESVGVVVRPETTYAVIEISHPDEYRRHQTVAVWGPPHLRAKVVERPICAFKTEPYVQELIGLDLPWGFRGFYNQHRYERAYEVVRAETVKEMAERRAEVEMNMAIIGSLNSMVAK